MSISKLFPMRQSFLICLLLLVSVSACKKETKDDDPQPTNVSSFRVNGLVDFTMRKTFNGNGRAVAHQMPVTVDHAGGEQQRVTLSLEDIPPRLLDTIFVSTGYPTFSTTLRFVDSGVADGTYTMKLVADGELSGRKEYPFKLIVEPVRDCTVGLLGSYTCGTSCVSPSPFPATVQPTSVRNQVIFSNLNSNGLQLTGNMVCDGPTYISIPSQTVNGVTYSGSGSLLSNGIKLIVYQAGPGSCHYNLTR